MAVVDAGGNAYHGARLFVPGKGEPKFKTLFFHFISMNFSMFDVVNV